jgi:hypothetical protein
LGVRIEFLIEGQYPGDGKPKPVSFPNPQTVIEVHGGVKYLQLSRLVELKLASGMSNSQRLKDLSDVVELIRLLGLPLLFEEQLNPYVRLKYRELWTSLRQSPTRYMMLWRKKSPGAGATSLADLIFQTDGDVETLKAMLADGVSLDPTVADADYYRLLSTDPIVAKKYGMHEESEFWDKDGE